MNRKKRRNLRFFIALFVAKITYWVIKLIAKNRGTNKPGVFAVKICPDFLSRIGLPNNIIAITGTNGKTTVTNMIDKILIDNNHTTVINNEGSNMETGVATALIAESTCLGNCYRNWGIFEIDERISARIYEHITPDYLLCLNLFRDSIKRNGHAEYIFNKINTAIPQTTTLILNADDLITSALQPNNQRIYFSVKPISKKKPTNIVQDIQVCPVCKELLIYQYRHHHHIGFAKCNKCKFSSPKSDYIAQKKDNNLLIFENKNKYLYPLISETIYNIYNTTAAITALRVMGLSQEQIKEGLAKVSLINNRENHYQNENQEILTILAKNQNPISSSMALDYTTQLKGNKIFILLVTDTLDHKHGSEDISWLYDTDFEFLNKKDIKQIIVCGSRCYDVSLRLQLAGIKEKLITTNENYYNIKSLIDNQKIDKIIIAYELYGYQHAINIKDEIVGDEYA